MTDYLVRNNHALVQQFATLILAKHWFWTSGLVPADRDPFEFDAYLRAKYGTDRSKHSQYRLFKKDIAKVRYLRVRGQRTFWLLATHGVHAVRQEEDMRDFRDTPALVGGYAVAAYGGRLSVRIERDTYRRLRAYFCAAAIGRSAAWLEGKLWALPFQPWRGVREQALQLVSAVNQRRSALRLLAVDHARAVRKKKRPLKVFLPGGEAV